MTYADLARALGMAESGVKGGHAAVARAIAHSLVDRLQRIAADFAQQHQVDQKLPEKEREGYTLLLAMRSWEFAAFTQLRR